MRDVDFLPDWYRQSLRCRRRARRQIGATLALVALIGMRLAISQHQTHVAASELAALREQLADAAAQVQETDRLSSIRAQWTRQQQRIDRLGVHIESARVLAALDEAMPGGVSLVDLQLNTDERPSTTSPAVPVAPMDRRLHVRLEGLAATPAELAKFLGRLQAIPFFEQPAVGLSKDVTENGCTLRQFEITFSINLNQPM